MGLFTRRKSSIQSFGSPTYDQYHQQDQSYYDKSPQLHPLPGETPSFYNQNNYYSSAPAPVVPLYNENSRPNTSSSRAPQRRLTKLQKRPATARSSVQEPPKLQPKLNKKNERPPSAASRVFVTNG